jgi:predicted nucleic acid-binding protein
LLAGAVSTKLVAKVISYSELCIIAANRSPKSAQICTWRIDIRFLLQRALPETRSYTLSTGVTSESNIIVSGDRHLLKASGYQNIETAKPREFLDKHLS